MPRIAELKEIDGGLWARIPSEMFAGDNGSVSLLYPSEIEAIRQKAFEECFEAIRIAAEGILMKT